MSKVIGFIVGAIEIGIGILTANPLLIIQGATMIIAQAVADLRHGPARQASEMTIQLGEQPRSAFFGEGFTAGSLVDAFDFGGKYGTDWEALVIRLADHKCEGLTGFYVNDSYVAYAGNGSIAGYNGQLHLYFRADTSTETLPTEATDQWAGWTSTDVGQSGCDVTVLYKTDKPDAKHPVWPGGRPRFGFVLKGKLCYDPRLDTTVGGSGAHRWDDPATWEWSENPAVCRYNWARGIYANDVVSDPTKLLVGRGLTAAEAPPANIFAAANLCDESVDGGVRYRIAGPVYADQQFLEVEEMFASATGGTVLTREGSVELEPGAAKSVVATFTDDDLLVGSKVAWNEAILSDSDGEWINTIVANYVEPAQQWNEHDAPVVRDTLDLIADGGPRESKLSLRLVKDVGQALRVAEIKRRLGRLWGRAGVTLGPRFCEIEEGDWVQWQSDRRFGGATRTFQVQAYSIDEKWQNTLTLREINADVFGDASTFDPDYSVVTVTSPPPDIGAPDDGHWALAAVNLTSGGVAVPALEITGDTGDDTTAEAILVEYWKSDGIINPVTNPDDPTWSVAGTYAPSTTKIDITSIEGGASYYAAVTYVVSGSPGDRLVLGPVTAGSVDVSGAVQPLIDSAITGLSWKTAVRARTTAALPANTYSNGSSGVGATLTGTANGALAAQDGVTLTTNERLLVANEATGSRNGIYKVTQVGDGSHPYILTRVTDADQAGELVNATVYVSEGTSYADTQWTCTTNAPITVGTTSLGFGQMGAGSATLTNGDYGDIVVSSSGTVLTVDNDAVTYAKMQNVSAASKLLGRGSASGSGDPQEITLGAGISMSGTTLLVSGGGGGTTTILTPILFQSGQLLPMDSLNFGTSTGSASANFISFFPFSKNCTIDAVVLEVTTAAGAGNTARVGLYTANASTRMPDTLIEEATSQSIASIGVKTFPFASSHAITDLVWIAVIYSASVTIRIGSVADGAVQFFGVTAVNGVNTNSRVGASYTFAALPSNTSALTMAVSNSTAGIAARIV